MLPFLMPRIGFQKARYLILSAHAITARNVLDWGLVDASDLLRIIYLFVAVGDVHAIYFGAHCRQIESGVVPRRAAGHGVLLSPHELIGVPSRLLNC
ncbi:hypothetical protein [Tahibacter sp.]|uniref:hypothetical protein n=1 Tax=Tahibacter sp. TaxID=2056211 RepID=UPI0028C3853D|nr:hypothetical protein [Tahibacter sp.]